MVCYNMLCHVMPRYDMLRCATLRYAVRCNAMHYPCCRVLLRSAMLCDPIVCGGVVCYAMRCCDILCYDMLCYAVLSYDMLC